MRRANLSVFAGCQAVSTDAGVASPGGVHSHLKPNLSKGKLSDHDQEVPGA